MKETATGSPGKIGQLKRTIVTPIFIVTVLGFSFSWMLYLTSSRRAVEDVVQRLVAVVSERIAARTEHILGTARSMALTEAGYLRTLADPAGSLSALRRSFHHQIGSFREIGIVSAGFETGDYAEAQRLEDGTIRTGLAGKSTRGALELWNADANGYPLTPALSRPDYDPRKRPWYLAAVERGEAGWSAIYSYVSNGDLAISASVPFYADDRALQGVCSVTVDLGGLGDSLAAFPEARYGVIGIVDAEGRLIAASNGSPISNPADGSRYEASTSPDPSIARSAKLLLGGTARTDFMQVMEDDWVGTAWRLDTKLYPDWRVFILVDKTAFLQTLAATDKGTALILFLTLAATLAIGWVTVDRITAPLRRLRSAVRALEPGGNEAGYADVIAELATRKDEIGGLAEAFSDMGKRLDGSFASLNASIAEKEVLLREVHHRVKNNLQIIASILNLQASEMEDDRVIAAFEVCQERIQAMAYVHEDIYQSGSFSEIEMQSYFGKICDSVRWAKSFGTEGIEMDVNAAGISLSLDKSIPCGLIVNELVMNSIRHAFPGGRRGRILVCMERDGGDLVLTVSDDGIGKLNALADRGNEPAGIGSHLVESLVAQLRGRMPEPDAACGTGTCVVIRFPA
ncbi:MAG: HAMP domain-containing protein [Spirochaetes bacterium]|nr:HAMP domain-containing protein [Spirochaetota bacterium]